MRAGDGPLPIGANVLRHDLPLHVRAGILGNGIVDSASEAYDDGNADDTEGCTAACTLSANCGNGRFDVGEQCDGDLLSVTCVTKGFAGGALGCRRNHLPIRYELLRSIRLRERRRRGRREL